ncbi:putative transcriptional regulator [Paraburkholderia sp. UCT70]|uniref:HVO_A0114 family putative DNA-binding protein n=1 Tax=Paraburkholderia sp. UCT70 TaxID=2991068 RepID=UPI003D1CD756
MTKVTLTVASRDSISARVVAATEGEAQGPLITFRSASELFQMLTLLRAKLIRTMVGAGPLSIHELARRLGRDVDHVHEDMHALLNVGVLERTHDGSFVLPYEVVRVDFTFTAADRLHE